MRSLFTFLFFLILFLAMGCKEREPIPTYYVSKEMLRYCWFPNDSYWIYEEGDSTGDFDSVYASHAGTQIYEDSEEGYNWENYTLALTIRGRRRFQSTNAWLAGSDGSHTLSDMFEYYSDSTVEESDHVLFWDTRGLNTTFVYPATKVVGRYDSLEIRGVVYHDVIEVATDPPSAAEYTYNVVWAKDIGVIRRSILDGTVWNLVRYHINR
ncbi:MAG: hypothetical protein IPN95_15150 [Bacteroidetes bacterium]|jgi:hypothetical protein|nr:hypothetical protein [Bacteroidota bacterium]MBL0017077.1 hypothetical protein [Bacteroidota bacterium]MBP6639753.1 hypothetical protein [Bacteroidia bacterium]MBP8073170.1 hypothetical protein [Bacteroidia bacterium]